MKFLRNERGLTLVEVIASIVILSISLLLFGSFFTRNYTISKAQDNRMLAMNLARQTADEWKSGNISPSEWEGVSDVVPGTFNSSIPIHMNGRSYIQTVEVSDIGKQDPQKQFAEGIMFLITVTVKEQNNPSAILARLSTGIPK